MSVDELRSGLARIAAKVVPDGDPYDRLMRHARRRRRRRFAGLGAALAGLLAAALLGPTATGAGIGGIDLWRDEAPLGEGYPVTSDWVWRLIDSPTRGNLAGDQALIEELADVFDRHRAEWRMADSLPEVKILYADESAGIRQVVVAYHSDTSAALVGSEGPAGATPRRLVRSHNGFANVRPEPLSVLDVMWSSPGRESQSLLALAPDGCAVSYAGSATVGADGALRREWQPSPTGDYLLLDEQRTRGWWRVECDGQVRQEGPVGHQIAAIGKPGVQPTPLVDSRPSGSPAPVEPDWRVERGASVSYRTLMTATGLSGVPEPVIRWAGRLEDGGAPDAVLVGPATGPGPVLLQVGGGDGALMALAKPEDATPDDTETLGASRATVPLVSTAVAASPDLIAVRIPARSAGHAVLTDRLLVVPPPGAVEVEMFSSERLVAGSPVRDGGAFLTVPIGSQVTLRALDRDGRVMASMSLREPYHGERLFNEPLVSDW